MGIKLVAIDLDGTLIGTDLQIPPRTRAAIAEARGRGVQFVIATGRMYQSAKPFARDLGLEGLPLVTYNGGLIKEYPSGETLHHEPVPLEICRKLAAFCEARGYHLQAYVDDKLYVSSMDKRTEQYVSIARVEAYPVGSIFLWLQEPSTKLLIVDAVERIPVIQAEVADLLGAGATVASSYPTFLEVVSSKVSKAVGLQAITGRLGIARDEVLAIGDAMNDVPMLSWAGIGVAISHAPEALKQVAAYVTQTGPGEGVAEALAHFGLVSES